MKTLEKRIQENLTKKDGSIKVAYEAINQVIANPTRKFRIHTWRISGGYSNLAQVNGQIVEALNLVGIDFEYGNDAPRGGKDGDYIVLTKKGQRQVAPLMRKRMKAAADRAEAAKQEAEAANDIDRQKYLSLHDIHVNFYRLELIDRN